MRSQIELAETDLLQWALSFLGAVAHEPLCFADQRAFEREHGLLYLGAVGGAVQYLPADIDPGRIEHVARALAGTPMDSAELRVALYELWLTTKHEKLSQEDRDAQLSVYVRRLSDYPAEHVRLVLGDLAEETRFFPAWSEIRERLAGLVGWRTTLTNALRRVHRKLREQEHGE